MHRKQLKATAQVFTLAVVLGIAGRTEVRGQETLRVYGSEGPAYPIREAAMVFERDHHIPVEVVSGAPDEWRQQAAGDADLIYASAEFMMTDFLRSAELALDPASVTPLYMRPSAVLARPGNPRNIQDFPDLLRPGVGIMVVEGGGQVGLWEDMAGKLGDVRTVRAFRRNIVLFASSSTAAMQAWKERSDIDAWVTWNIWQVPLHDAAHRVRISKSYLIYRQCNIALTQRGRNHPHAQAFIDFLVSPEGTQIFLSWEWMALTTEENPITVHQDICIVCPIKADAGPGRIAPALFELEALLEDYRSIGISQDDLHVTAVFQGPAAVQLLNDEAYQRMTGSAQGNPNKEIIRRLTALGVSMELCAKSRRSCAWSEAHLLQDVTVVPSAEMRIVDLELQGYALLGF